MPHIAMAWQLKHDHIQAHEGQGLRPTKMDYLSSSFGLIIQCYRGGAGEIQTLALLIKETRYSTKLKGSRHEKLETVIRGQKE